jgi:hypothetical protein
MSVAERETARLERVNTVQGELINLEKFKSERRRRKDFLIRMREKGDILEALGLPVEGAEVRITRYITGLDNRFGQLEGDCKTR